jgi:hypothetical protein
VGLTVKFTASVTSNAGTIPDGETVTFTDGIAYLGKGTLSGGTMVLSTSALTAGTHTIRAEYVGDFRFALSISSAITQVVNK